MRRAPPRAKSESATHDVLATIAQAGKPSRGTRLAANALDARQSML